jgi:hypothetical protein
MKRYIHVEKNEDLSKVSDEFLWSLICYGMNYANKGDVITDTFRSKFSTAIKDVKIFLARCILDDYFEKVTDKKFLICPVEELQENSKVEIHLVPSSDFAKTGFMYQILYSDDEGAFECDCKGFSFKGNCRHLDVINKRIAKKRIYDDLVGQTQVLEEMRSTYDDALKHKQELQESSTWHV